MTSTFDYSQCYTHFRLWPGTTYIYRSITRYFKSAIANRYLKLCCALDFDVMISNNHKLERGNTPKCMILTSIIIIKQVLHWLHHRLHIWLHNKGKYYKKQKQ